MKFPRERLLVEVVRQRPSDSGGGGELQIFADDSEGKGETAGNLALRKTRVVSEPEEVFDPAHGKPVDWHRVVPPLVEKMEDSVRCRLLVCQHAQALTGCFRCSRSQ